MSGRSGILNEIYGLLKRTFPESSAGMERTMGRAERIERENPDLLRPFDSAALASVLQRSDPLVAVRPGDFEGGLAFMFPEKFTASQPRELGGYLSEEDKRRALTELSDYIDELTQVARDTGFNDIPFLGVAPDFIPGPNQDDELIGLAIRGHEGRHRSRALERLGYPEMLVRAYPRLSAIKPPEGVSKDQYLADLIDSKPPVLGEETGYWAGGEDYPFLSRYAGGGRV